MLMRSSLLALAAAALATALASAASADSPGPGQTARNSSRLYYYQPANPIAGDTSLYDLFRGGRYDTSTYLRAHPLPDGSAPSSSNGSPYPSD